MGSQRDRTRRLQALSLGLTVVLGAALIGITYFSVTTLPYLSTSPATDPHFGSLNACLLQSVPSRLGFAVSDDGKRAAAWSAERLVECAGEPATPTSFDYSNITFATYDRTGALWLALSAVDGGAGQLLRHEKERFVERGAFSPSALVGTSHGVVALEPSGQLIAVSTDGTVSATRLLPLARKVEMATSHDGEMVALWGGGRFAVVNASTLESTPAEVACPVRRAWWRAQVPLLIVDCLDITVEVNALNSESALLEPRRRTDSTLLGAASVYVQPCDMLPCSAEAPR